MLKVLSGYLTGDGYAARAFRGSALTVVSFGGQNILRLASNLVLTRLLFPEAFGLMALVSVVLSGAAQFSDIGIRGSIVQDKRGEDPVFLNTAWTLQILRGFILGAAVFLLSGPIATFYEAPELADLLKIAALVPILQGFGSTRLLSANRTIQLGRLTALNLGTQVFSIIVMVALAWWFESVWALLAGVVIGAAAQTVLSFFVLDGEKNRLHLERDAARRLFQFGKFIFFSTIAGFLINQSDRLVLGKFVTLEELAVYNIGYFLAAMPFLLASMLNERIFFPLYARRPPAENEHNRAQINKARFMVTSGTVFLATCLAVIGDPLVRFLYDARYHSAGAITTLIALSLIPRMITVSYERMALASGHSGRFALLAVTIATVQLTLTLFGVMNFGLLGAIVAPPVSILLTYPLMVWINWPYRGWHGLHDLIFALAGLAIIAAVIWLRWPAITPLLPG